MSYDISYERKFKLKCERYFGIQLLHFSLRSISSLPIPTPSPYPPTPPLYLSLSVCIVHLRSSGLETWDCSFMCVYSRCKLRISAIYYLGDQIEENWLGGACSTRAEMTVAEKNLVGNPENRRFCGRGCRRIRGQWLRCCATNRKVAGSIQDCVIGIFHWRNPSDRTMALGSTEPLTETSTRSISWEQRRPVRKADNLTTILCCCHVIWEPLLPGILWACPGL